MSRKTHMQVSTHLNTQLSQTWRAGSGLLYTPLNIPFHSVKWIWMRKRRSGEEVWRLEEGNEGNRVGNWQEGRRKEGRRIFHLWKKKTGPIVIELHGKDLLFSFFALQPFPLLVPSLITIAAAKLCVCVFVCVSVEGGGPGRAVWLKQGLPSMVDRLGNE